MEFRNELKANEWVRAETKEQINFIHKSSTVTFEFKFSSSSIILNSNNSSIQLNWVASTQTHNDWLASETTKQPSEGYFSLSRFDTMVDLCCCDWNLSPPQASLFFTNFAQQLIIVDQHTYAPACNPTMVIISTRSLDWLT